MMVTLIVQQQQIKCLVKGFGHFIQMNILTKNSKINKIQRRNQIRNKQKKKTANKQKKKT